MVLINDNQLVPVNAEELKTNTQTILNVLGYSDFDIGILLTTRDDMRNYNLEYRDKDKPTDILSFPFYPHLKAGEKIIASTQDEKNLGDLIICPEYIQEQVKELGTTFNDRVKVLLVHGICHLLGYDHETDQDYEIMHKKESELLKHIT